MERQDLFLGFEDSLMVFESAVVVDEQGSQCEVALGDYDEEKLRHLVVRAANPLKPETGMWIINKTTGDSPAFVMNEDVPLALASGNYRMPKRGEVR